MSWHKKVITKHKKEIIESVLVSLSVATVFSLLYYSRGESFFWMEINPISLPTIPSRIFYSALVFRTLGALLFSLFFYKGLAKVIGGWLGDWRLYWQVKAFIWAGLMWLMFKYIVPFFIDLLNNIISFFYNIWLLTLYIFPVIAVFIVFSGLYLYIKTKHRTYANF